MSNALMTNASRRPGVRWWLASLLTITGCLAPTDSDEPGEPATSTRTWGVGRDPGDADHEFPNDRFASEDLADGTLPDDTALLGQLPAGDHLEGDLRDLDLLPSTSAPPPLVLADPAGPAPVATVTVTTAAQLVAHLGSATPETIIVPGTLELNLTAFAPIAVKAGKTLTSDRGRRRLGALLYSTDNRRKYDLFVVQGSDVRFDGVRIIGPTGGVDEPYSISGIRIRTGAEISGQRIRYSNIVVTNSELAKWPGAAVTVDGPLTVECFDQLPLADRLTRPAHVMSKAQAGQVTISHSYIHHNQRHKSGYGVVVGGGAYASIQANTFEYNRHSVASSGTPYSGYIARYNYTLESVDYQGPYPFHSYPTHYDMHGCEGSDGVGGDAGEYIELSYNTIRGEQDFVLGVLTRSAFRIRGTPRDSAWFLENVVVHNNADAAIRVDGTGSDPPIYESGNTYNADRSLEMGVGDFDGDGRDDVFLATGIGWYFSSGGTAPWRFLTRSSKLLGDIAIGDFDGDHFADVFEGTGSRWRYFSGRDRAWKNDLADSAAQARDLRFGDFDGNGKTDVFRADGTAWFVSWDGRSAWDRIMTSAYGLDEIALGDFDGDGKTDVLSMALGQWSWSRSGAGAWQKLNDRLVNGVGNLVLGDFNGDGKTDIAFEQNAVSGLSWHYASGGRGAAIRMRGTTGGYNKHLRRGVVGHFLPDSKDVFVRYSEYSTADHTGKTLVRWHIGQGSDSFTSHSYRNMR